MDEDRDQVSDLPLPHNQRDRRSYQTSSPSSDESKDLGYTEYSSSAIRQDSVYFEAPSQSEIHHYFFGLSGNPELLARTSHDDFVRLYDGTFPRPKRVFNVGIHDIVDRYGSAREAIHEILADVKWSKLDIVRVGYSREAGDNPVVLLITVHTGTITYFKASKAVHACQEILQK
jgi:hypothetical protein